jgi:hypothetical protein
MPECAARSRAWARDLLAWQWGVGKDESLDEAWGVALPKLLVPLATLQGTQALESWQMERA